MIYASLCSGIEAASLAWKPLGWKAEFFAQHDPEHAKRGGYKRGPDFPSEVLATHYPEVLNRGDITKFKAWPAPERPVDVLVGGTPCQSFSVAGLRKGLDDPRGNLALVFLAIADALRPRWILWENVPGVLSVNKGRSFGAFVGALGQLGYGWAYRVLDAQYFGVPQRRRRVFVVGHLGDWRRAAAVLFERESLSGNPPPRREAGQRTAARLTRGADSSGRGGYAGRRREDDENLWPVEVAPTLDAHYGEKQGLENQHVDAGGGLFVQTGGFFDEPAKSLRAQSQLSHREDQDNLVVHALTGEGRDANEDGTGRDCPIIPIQEIGKRTGSGGEGQNGCGIGDPGDAMFTLQAGAQHGVAVDTFNGKIDGEVAATVSAGIGKHNSAGAQVMAFDCKAGGDTSFSIGDKPGALRGDGHGGGHAAIAFDSTRVTSKGNYSNPKPGDPCHPLAAGAHLPAVAMQEAQTGCREYDTAGSLRANGPGHDPVGTRIRSGMRVRRLTPRECERLMGFPDDYTLIPVGKKRKPAADGPRYKAIGNSMVRQCMEWLGRRIELVEALTKKETA